MATNSSNALNLLTPAARPVDGRTAREFSPKNDQNFGAQFKSEMNRAQQAKPAENRATKSVDKASSQDRSQESASQDAVNAKPVAEDVKKTADSTNSAPESEENQEQTTAATNGDLNALLAMMQVVTPPVGSTPQTQSQTVLDEEKAGQGGLLAVGDDGAKNRPAKLSLGLADATDDALTQDDASRHSPADLALQGMGAKTSSSANIAAVGVAVLPHELSAEDALQSKEHNAFADTLAIKMNTPGLSSTGLGASSGIQPMPTASAAHTASNSVVASHYVETPVQDARWSDAVAQRVSLMLGKQEQQIEMHLNPPNLGPMEVRLNLGNEQASVIFTSQHAAVREALAAATPKLTALLADQGIVLQNVQVASDSLHQHQQNQQQQQQAQSFDSGPQTARFTGAGVTLGSQAIERVVNLSDLRIPAGSTRVSLFV